MLRSILNKNKYYYEIGVIKANDPKSTIIAEYVTALPIIKYGIAHNKFVDYLHDLHGDNILILMNKKEGKMPKDSRLVIDINIPKTQKLKYNR